MAKFIDKSPSVFRLFWRLGGWFGLIFLLAGVGVFIGSGFVGLKAWRLAQEGEVVMGEVLDTRLRESRDSDGHTSTTYYISFQFDTLTGERIKDENSVQRKTYHNASDGDLIEVRYWPEDPMQNEIEPGASRIMALIMGALSLPFMLVGGAFVTRQIRFAFGAVRTRDQGDALKAEVTQHLPTSLKVNGRRYYRLEWRDENGNMGMSRHANPNTLKDYTVGSTITVFVDPHAVTKGVWEGDVGQPKSGYTKASRSARSSEKDGTKRQSTVRRN